LHGTPPAVRTTSRKSEWPASSASAELEHFCSVSLLAYPIIAKYCDALPLYRFETTLKRYGGSINRSTIASWLIRLSQQLQCGVNLMQEEQLIDI